MRALKKEQVPYYFVTFSGDPKHALQIARKMGNCQSSAPSGDVAQQQGLSPALLLKRKALEADRRTLEAERKALDAERRALIEERRALDTERNALEERLSVLEAKSLALTSSFVPDASARPVEMESSAQFPTTVVTAAGTLSKGKLHNWVDPQQVVELTIRNTLDGAPADAADLSEEGNRSVLGWMEGNTLHLAGEWSMKAPQNCSYLFSTTSYNSSSFARWRWDKMEQVNGGAWLDTSGVTDMSGMFLGCSSLTKLDVSIWDTSSVKNMGWMFEGCSSLTKLDVSNWDTARVTRMRKMIYNCKSLTELDVSRWDISKVENKDEMFKGTQWASHPPYPFNQ